MKVVFKKDVLLKRHYNICCFSGMHSVDYDHQSAGPVTVHAIWDGDKPGTKTIAVNDETIHPDRWVNVPVEYFDVEE